MQGLLKLRYSCVKDIDDNCILKYFSSSSVTADNSNTFNFDDAVKCVQSCRKLLGCKIGDEKYNFIQTLWWRCKEKSDGKKFKFNWSIENSDHSINNMCIKCFAFAHGFSSSILDEISKKVKQDNVAPYQLFPYLDDFDPNAKFAGTYNEALEIFQENMQHLDIKNPREFFIK